METWIALAIFAVITVVLLVAILRTLRSRYPAPTEDSIDRIPPQKLPDDEPWVRFPFVIVVAMLIVLATSASANSGAPQKNYRVVLNTGNCPPDSADALPIFTFTVYINPDTGKAQSSCARMFKRTYAPRRAPQSSTKE